MSFDIPAACTLPAAEHPLRLAEFDALFTATVRAFEQVGPFFRESSWSPEGSSAIVGGDGRPV